MNWYKIFIYLGAIFIGFTFSAYFTVNILLKTEGSIVCPDVRGKTVEEAKQLLKSKGLSMSIARYERRNNVPYNHITIQKPEANISTRKGRTVLVIVSEGPELMQLPVLSGQSLERVAETLKSKNIVIEKTIFTPNQNIGKVISHIPGAGQDILEGHGVTLLVGSRADMYYLMPDTTGMTASEISEEMDRHNIKNKITYINNDHTYTKPVVKVSVPSKTIFRQDNDIEIKVFIGG